MTEEQKTVAMPYAISPEDAQHIKPVPPAVYPEMAMPENPKVTWAPPTETNPRPSCDGGDVCLNPDVSSSPVPPPPPGGIRIMIGIPLLDIKYEFFESFMRFWTQMCVMPKNYEISYLIAYRKPVHMAEEWLVKQAQYNKCTHILFIDDDVYDITKEQLDTLLAADKDFIGGVMYASKFPHAMCCFRKFDSSRKVIDMPSDTSIYRLYEIPCNCPTCGTGQSHWDAKFCPNCGSTQSNLIQQVDLSPFPFTLIKLSVFDKIKKPWFHCTSYYPTDSWFADRMEEAGLKEYCHMGVRLNHAGVSDFTRPYYVQMGMAKSQAARAVVNISPEQMEVHQQLMANKMKAAEESIKDKPLIIGTSNTVVANDSQGVPLTLMTHGT